MEVVVVVEEGAEVGWEVWEAEGFDEVEVLCVGAVLTD